MAHKTLARRPVGGLERPELLEESKCPQRVKFPPLVNLALVGILIQYAFKFMDEYSDPTPIATVEQFKAALLKVRDNKKNGMSEKDLALLRSHCRAPNHTISTSQLAKALGYSSFSAVNMHYGKLAHDIADALNYKPIPNSKGDYHWWRTLCYGNDGTPQKDDGHYEWIMRPELVQALNEWKSATTLKAGFVDYLNGLQIAKTSKDNYRQYARWIERYGSGTLDFSTLQDESKLASFINRLAKNFDADKKVIRQHRFNNRRKSDVKTILHHYLIFLQSSGGGIEETQTKLDVAGEFKVSGEQDGKEKVLRSIALRRGQPKFRAALLRAYAGKCAVTGTSISDILEAAHIIPYSGVSTNHISNGLLLRSDIHALFDLRLLSIDPTNLCVYCSQQIQHEPMYVKLNGKTISTPDKSNEQPNRKALEKHFEKRLV